jgi:hypothetical protein
MDRFLPPSDRKQRKVPAKLPCSCFTLYRNHCTEKAENFSKIYYNTSFRGLKLNSVSAAPTAKICASIRLVLLILVKQKVPRLGGIEWQNFETIFRKEGQLVQTDIIDDLKNLLSLHKKGKQSKFHPILALIKSRVKFIQKITRSMFHSVPFHNYMSNTLSMKL